MRTAGLNHDRSLSGRGEDGLDHPAPAKVRLLPATVFQDFRVVAAGVLALALLSRRGRLPPAPTIPRRLAQGALAATTVVAIGLFFAADGPTRLEDGWEKFKQPTNPGA